MDLTALNELLYGTHKSITQLQSQGEFFNVFSVLGLQNDERKHSSFIANLLDPQGSHGQKDLFLKCFINSIDVLKIKLSGLSVGGCLVQTEKYLGKCDVEYNEGGSIDIVISNSKFTIFIENKIWAGDQPNQLYRYCSYNKQAIVLYLTPEGKNPGPVSTLNGEVKKGEHYFCISYSEHILKWLEECISSVFSKNKISGTLLNYKYVIEEITRGGNMGEMIINKIIESEDTIESAFYINRYFDEVKIKLLDRLAKQLEEKIDRSVFDIKRDPDWGIDNESYLFFTYKNSKIKTRISFCFAKRLNELQVGIDSVNEKIISSVRDKIIKKLEGFGKDLGGGYVKVWYFLSPVPGAVYDWDNPDIWKGIFTDQTADQLLDIVKEIDERIKDII